MPTVHAIWDQIVKLRHKFANEGDSLKANNINRELERLHKLLRIKED